MSSVVDTVGSLIGAKHLFKTPTPPAAGPAPSAETTAVQKAVSEAAQRRSRARGYRSTILSQHMMSAENPALKDTYGS